MEVKFFADDFNDRRCWSWKDGEYVTSDTAEIEELTGLGVRHEEVEPPEVKKAVEKVKKEVKARLEKKGKKKV